jgi:L-lactate dehydrogenase complex protein LldF
VLLKLLARSATGQKITTYTSFISGPRREEGEGGPRALHVVLLDNGRSGILRDEVARETLKCIRCGCCLNVCPVYKNVGGYAYGWFISGPIGAIFTPQILGTRIARELPYASSLCGACVDVCPVKIPITKILLHLRQRIAQGDSFAPASAPIVTRLGAKLTRFGLRSGALYRLAGRLLPLLERPLVRDGWIARLPPPLNRWTRVRPMPAFRSGFRSWWRGRAKGAGQR